MIVRIINSNFTNKLSFTIALTKILLYIFLFLLFMNFLGIISTYFLHHGTVYGLVQRFDFNTEQSIPAIFSTFILLISSLLLFLIAIAEKKSSRPYIAWMGLAIIFLFLSIDESTSFHETFTFSIRSAYHMNGFFYYAWVIPYGIALIIFLILYAGFLIRLPSKYRILFIISGAIYVGGAVGMEMIGGAWASHHGTQNFIYALLYTVEESMEMLGIILFIWSLIQYIEKFYNIELIIEK